MTTPNELAGLIERLRRQAKREAACYDAIPQCVSFVGVEDTASWQAADMLERLSPTEATEPLVERAKELLAQSFERSGEQGCADGVRRGKMPGHGTPLWMDQALSAICAALSSSISNAPTDSGEVVQAAKRETLADCLERILSERGAAAVMNDGETEGAVMRRVVRHNQALAQIVGEQWPTILAALRDHRLAFSRPEPLGDEALVERVAAAIEDVAPSHHIKLIGLIDGVSTYRLTVGDEEPREFVGVDAYSQASEHLGHLIRLARARAAITALYTLPAADGPRGFCNKCGYSGPLSNEEFLGQHKRPGDGQDCNYSAVAIPAPATDAGQSADSLVEAAKHMLVRGAEPTDAKTAEMARLALGRWLAWPDAARDGPVEVDNSKVCSWLQGVPAALAKAGQITSLSKSPSDGEGV